MATIDEDNDLFEVEQPDVKKEKFQDYTKTTHDVNNPKLITLRGRSSDFLETRVCLTKIMRRSNLQKNHVVVNGIQFKVKNLQNKIYSTEADVETIDEKNLKGQSILTIYKDNKKKAGKRTKQL